MPLKGRVFFFHVQHLIFWEEWEQCRGRTFRKFIDRCIILNLLFERLLAIMFCFMTIWYPGELSRLLALPFYVSAFWTQPVFSFTVILTRLKSEYVKKRGWTRTKKTHRPPCPQPASEVWWDPNTRGRCTVGSTAGSRWKRPTALLTFCCPRHFILPKQRKRVEVWNQTS